MDGKYLKHIYTTTIKTANKSLLSIKLVSKYFNQVKVRNLPNSSFIPSIENWGLLGCYTLTLPKDLVFPEDSIN